MATYYLYATGTSDESITSAAAYPSNLTEYTFSTLAEETDGVLNPDTLGQITINDPSFTDPVEIGEVYEFTYATNMEVEFVAYAVSINGMVYIIPQTEAGQSYLAAGDSLHYHDYGALSEGVSYSALYEAVDAVAVPTLTGTVDPIELTEDGSTNVNLSQLTFSQEDDLTITVTLSVENGTLTAADDVSLTVTGSGTDTVTLEGAAADINAYLDTITSISYASPENANGEGYDSLSISAVDSEGGEMEPFSAVTIDVEAVNDAPVINFEPTTLIVTEDTATVLDLSGLSFSDVDYDEAYGFGVAFEVSSGTLSFEPSEDLVFLVEDGTYVLLGTLEDINAYIATVGNVTYTPAENANGEGAATIQIGAVDQVDGELNAEGAELASLEDAITFDITSVNDAPTLSADIIELNVVEDEATGLDLSGLSFADVESDELVLTLSVTAGDLTALASQELLVQQLSASTVVLTGSVTDLQAYLANSANLTYTTELNANGSVASLNVQVSDGEEYVSLQSGIPIVAEAVNDAPVISFEATTLTIAEDTATVLDLSSLSFSDVDVEEGADVGVAFVATSGDLTFAPSSSVDLYYEGGEYILIGTLEEINAYLATEGAVTYTPAEDMNGEGAAAVMVAIADSLDGIMPGEGALLERLDPAIVFDITPANDAPELVSDLTSQTVLEDVTTGLDLTGLSISDVDGDELTLTLTASAGTLSTTGGEGLFTTGSNTSTLTITGTGEAISTFLSTMSSVTYTGAENANGEAAATISATYTDGVLGDTVQDILTIDITPVNDAPTAILGNTEVELTEDELGALDLSGLTLLDIEGDDITVTLSVTSGSLYAETFPGLTLSSDTYGALTITGSAADLTTYFATPDYLSYLGADDAWGEAVATLSIRVSDGEDETVYEQAVDLNIAPVNDAPEGELYVMGEVENGGTLSVMSFISDADGLGMASFQWFADGEAIEGATGYSYELTEDEIGTQITVELSYTDGAGFDEVVSGSVEGLVGYGDLELSGSGESERLVGREGDDLIYGRAGQDVLKGWAGNDALYGNYGDDELYGNNGDDYLDGGKGKDILNGGFGNDYLVGGQGADVFVFNSNSGTDQIADFGRGNDTIQILDGAERMRDLSFNQVEDDVYITFGESTIIVADTNVEDIQSRDFFDFG